MSELIDRIPGVQSTLATLRGVVETTQQIKAAQKFTGRSGQLAYTVSSSNTWDRVEVFPYTAPPGYLTAGFSIRYTSDGSQPYPIVIPSTDVRVNGTGVGNRPTLQAGGSFYTYADGAGDILIQNLNFEQPDQAFFGSTTESRWNIDVLYRGNVTLYIKARGQASCDGTWSVVRTY